MRTLQNLKAGYASVLLFILGLLANAKAYAQDKDINITIDAENDVAWYNLWWVWVIAGALFLIVIVAIVSAGKKA